MSRRRIRLTSQKSARKKECCCLDLAFSNELTICWDRPPLSQQLLKVRRFSLRWDKRLLLSQSLLDLARDAPAGFRCSIFRLRYDVWIPQRVSHESKHGRRRFGVGCSAKVTHLKLDLALKSY